MPKFSPLSVLPLVLAAACAGDSDGDGDPSCDTLLYADSDGDGYGDPATSAGACDAPVGYVERSGDCDDERADINPEAQEICDGSDNDCNQLVDSADPAIDLSTERDYYADSDGDGHGDPETSQTSCDKPSGYALSDDDCDDSNASVYPEAAEVCDFLDNDCDQLFDDEDSDLDPASAGSYYADGDADGYGIGDPVIACVAPVAHSDQSGDCDDDDPSAHPGATEICDGVDNDCDGGSDGTPAAPDQCAALEGVLTGSYTHYTAEKLGTTVINEMNCSSGSSTITIDVEANPAVQGSLSCTYGGGLGGFNGTQSATLEAVLTPDGTVEGSLTHTYGFQMERTYSFVGALDSGELTIDGTGSWLPNPMSAVPWQTDYAVVAGD